MLLCVSILIKSFCPTSASLVSFLSSSPLAGVRKYFGFDLTSKDGGCEYYAQIERGHLIDFGSQRKCLEEGHQEFECMLVAFRQLLEEFGQLRLPLHQILQFYFVLISSSVHVGRFVCTSSVHPSVVQMELQQWVRQFSKELLER